MGISCIRDKVWSGIEEVGNKIQLRPKITLAITKGGRSAHYVITTSNGRRLALLFSEEQKAEAAQSSPCIGSVPDNCRPRIRADARPLQ